MTQVQLIGPTTMASFPELGVVNIPARVDTGAKTSAIWASGVIEENGVLQFVLFGPESPYYSGEVLQVKKYGTRTVSSSIGETEDRYLVKLLVHIEGRKIRASFTLANRSQQAYPMLVGRNILAGKFVVDVRHQPPVPISRKSALTNPKSLPKPKGK